MARTRTSSYSEGEITRMIENYAALKNMVDTKPGFPLTLLLRMADLDYALDRLPLDLWRVVLVHGLLQVQRDDAARELHLSTGAVSKRFQLGIEEVAYHMNGGT
jgi:DNA-directed RNA polymerase specialized sigma24 family protein